MAKQSYSISFEQATDTPLKILPKNTWVKINNFKNPCRLLEISAQSLTIDVKSEPETLTLHAGQSIKVQILNFSNENPFELQVTIFYINDSECLCQIPLFIDNEQILVDKIILEIQKNEIGVKKAPVPPPEPVKIRIVPKNVPVLCPRMKTWLPYSIILLPCFLTKRRIIKRNRLQLAS